MKKLLSSLLIAALLALCASALAADNVRFVTSAYVYAEAGSGRTETIIRKGSVARRMDGADGWVCVRFGKHAGWVRGSCLAPSDDPVKVVYSAMSSPASAVRSAQLLRGASASAIGPVSVTSTIAPDASALATVQAGETVTCLGNYIVGDDGGTFVEISHGLTIGWVPAVALSGLPVFD